MIPIADLVTLIFSIDDDIVLWKKFAASLKLRIALRLSDVPTINSGAMVSQALSAGVFTDQIGKCNFPYFTVLPLM